MLADRGHAKVPRPFRELLHSAIKKIEARFSAPKKSAVCGIPTGLQSLDDITQGYQPSLVVSLSRKCEERQDKRPVPSDIRDTGNIESDADTICMIYRDEVYNADTEDKGIAELIIRKGENMRQTYNHAGVQIYHGDCRDLVLTEPADVLISDPPFSATFGQLANKLTHLADYVRTWCVMTCDWRHATELERSPPIGWEFVRAGIWVKPDGTPQMTGDRPGTGWEAIAFLHRTKPDGKPMKKRWNGGGRNSVFTHGVCRDAMYPTQKPVALVSEFVRLFTKPGDTILDPFCGSGTTLYAAKELRRKAIGCDVSADACALAEKRLAQDLLPMGENR